MSDDDRAGQLSRYLGYLPAIFQQNDQGEQATFLGRFLLAFEQVLTGLGDPSAPGIEELLDGIPGALDGIQRYFEPGPGQEDNQRAPAEFLDWLAGWVALALRADMDEVRQRDLIARAVTLYRMRGTKRGLEEMITIYTRLPPTINELNIPFQIGVHSRVGDDTLLDGGAAHFFNVTLQLPDPDPKELARQTQLASAIIDMEKPAHTYYTLKVVTPEFQIGVKSTIGVDTLLGPTPAHA